MVRKRNTDGALGPVALLVWAEALRNPALQQKFQESLTQLRRDLAKVVKEQQRAGTLPSGVGADAIASLLLAVVPGYILQLTLLGDSSPAKVSAAARALWPD